MTNVAPSLPARPASEIPVAPSVPLLGSLPWMAVDAAQFLERVAQEKGPIVRIPFGKAGMVMLTHPDDARYTHLIGKKVWRPLGERIQIPIIADEAVDPAFAAGALKVTPAHDKVDFEIGQRHGLPIIESIEFHPG